MLINFNEIETNIVEHMKGGTKEVHVKAFSDDLNKIMCNTLVPGSSLGLHTHETNSEIIYVISGNGKMIYDDSEYAAYPGAVLYCPKGHTHSLINNSDADLVIFAVVCEQ